MCWNVHSNAIVNVFFWLLLFAYMRQLGSKYSRPRALRCMYRWTKGFRTGSKILSAAVTLDLLTVMLRLGEYLYLYNSLSTLWWSKFNITKSDWVIFAAANLLDSIALISYGWALFYIECYHDEGTSEEVAWTMLALFSLAGLSSEHFSST